MHIDLIHDCTLVLYKQLIKTGLGCYPSYFTLCRDFLSIYEDTDLRRATAHQLYCFAIEAGFGVNASAPSVEARQDAFIKEIYSPGSYGLNPGRMQVDRTDSLLILLLRPLQFNKPFHFVLAALSSSRSPIVCWSYTFVKKQPLEYKMVTKTYLPTYL